MTKLEGPLRRELTIGKDHYTLTIAPDGLKLVPKGKRKGYALSWRAFIDGDAALAVALNASLAHGPSSRVAKQVAPTKKTRMASRVTAAAQAAPTAAARRTRTPQTRKRARKQG
jgi:hypothetical protein